MNIYSVYQGNVKYQVLSSSLSDCLLFNASFLLCNIALIWSAKSFLYSLVAGTLTCIPLSFVVTDFSFSLLFLIYSRRLERAYCCWEADYGCLFEVLFVFFYNYVADYDAVVELSL